MSSKPVSDLIQLLCSDPNISIVECVAQLPPERRVLKLGVVRKLALRLSLAPHDTVEQRLLLAAAALLALHNCDAMNESGMLDTVGGLALTGGLKTDRRSSNLTDLLTRQQGRSSTGESQSSRLGQILEVGDVHLPGGGVKANSGNLAFAILLISVPKVSGRLSDNLVEKILELLGGPRTTDSGFRTHGVSLLSGLIGKAETAPPARLVRPLMARLSPSLYTSRVEVCMNILRELRDSGASLGDCVRPLTEIVLCERSPCSLMVESANLLACDDVHLAPFHDDLRRRFMDLYREHFSSNENVDAARASGRMACAVLARLVVRSAGDNVNALLGESLSERLLEVLRQLVYVKSEAGLLTPRTVVKMHMELSWLKGEDPFEDMVSRMVVEDTEGSSTASMSLDSESTDRETSSQSSDDSSCSRDAEPRAKRLKVEPRRLPLKRPRPLETGTDTSDETAASPSSVQSAPCPIRQGPLLKRHRTCHPTDRPPWTSRISKMSAQPATTIRAPGKSLLRRLPSDSSRTTRGNLTIEV